MSRSAFIWKAQITNHKSQLTTSSERKKVNNNKVTVNIVLLAVAKEKRV